MRAFNHNIKLIRSLTGKNQDEFARLIRSKTSNIKTWETTKSLPRNHIIYKKIAELAGVSIEQIKNKTLEEKDIKLQVEKVENDTTIITPKRYIKMLEDDKLRAIQREDNIMKQLVANSAAMMHMLTSLYRHDQVFHETILRSLGRLEGDNKDLVLEARSFEAQQQVQDSLMGSKKQDDTQRREQ